MNKKIIFLDFDGVLFDSVKEAYLLARYAYYDIPVKNKIDEKHYQKFRKYRYLITHSWHYYYIFKLLESNFNNFEREYYNMIDNRQNTIDSFFDKKYQQQRKNLITNDFNYWQNLEKPYNFFFEIKKIKNNFNIIIISTKNEFAIKRHLNNYFFNLDDKKIIGKETLETYKTKSNFIKNYMKSSDTKIAAFIDDNENNLNECRNINNLKCIQALWGYVKPEKKSNNYFDVLKQIKEL